MTARAAEFLTLPESIHPHILFLILIISSTMLGLEKRHWNLEASSAVVEFLPPYLLYISYII